MMTPGHDPIPGQNTHRYLIEDGAQCLKSTEKVAFNIASEASYVFYFEWPKVDLKCQKCSIWRFFENLKLAVKKFYQTGHFKIGGKYQS